MRFFSADLSYSIFLWPKKPYGGISQAWLHGKLLDQTFGQNFSHFLNLVNWCRCCLNFHQFNVWKKIVISDWPCLISQSLHRTRKESCIIPKRMESFPVARAGWDTLVVKLHELWIVLLTPCVTCRVLCARFPLSTSWRYNGVRLLFLLWPTLWESRRV